MTPIEFVRRQWLLALAYGLSAAITVSLTRFNGGVAFVWAATAILIAALLRTAPRHWWAPLSVCGAVSALITGVLGLGWAAALPFAAINLFEAVVAAWLFRRLADPHEPMQSLAWYARFVLAVGVIAPLAATFPATLVTAWMGHDPARTAISFFCGHALGNLALTPIAMLMTGRRRQRETLGLLRRRIGDVLAVVGILAATSVAVFGQSRLPLLFLPVMMIVLATFRLGRVGAAIGVLVVAIIGGIFTAANLGPVTLLQASAGGKAMFFQFYLAATVLTVVPVSADLHRRASMFRKLRINEERFRLLAEHSSDLLLHIGLDGRFRYVSPSMRVIGGYDPAQLVGQHSAQLIAPEDRLAVHQAHQRVLEAGGRTVGFTYRGVLSDGSQRWFETHAQAYFDDEGRLAGSMSVVRDIHAREERERRLSHAAMTDALTGIANRRAFEARVAERASDPANVDQDCIAVFDLDHFKGINDRYGHDSGDAVLRAFAQLARRAIRHGDLLARLGGEEFVVLFPDTDIARAAEVCERLRAAVARQPLDAGGQAIRCTVSGGVARIGSGGIGEALKIADAALYRAKRGGRDQLALAA